MIDALYTAVVGSACSCVLEAGSDREDRFLDAYYVGDTGKSLSAKMMTASSALINCPNRVTSQQSYRRSCAELMSSFDRVKENMDKYYSRNIPSSNYFHVNDK